MHRLVRHSALAVAAVSLSAVAALAQKYQPVGADTLSPGAVAESLAVLKMLDSTVRANPKNAQAWYRLGMVAWALATRDKAHRGEIKGLDHTRLGRMADTSLRISQALAPDSSRYAMAAATYLRQSGFMMTRLGAVAQYNNAVDAGRNSKDPDQHAEAAMQSGVVKWRRYETFAHRRMEVGLATAPRSVRQGSSPMAGAMQSLMEQAQAGMGGSASPPGTGGSDPGQMTVDMAQSIGDLGPGSFSLKGVLDGIEQLTMDLPFSVQGQDDYVAAEALFREAYNAAPKHLHAFRNLAMLLIEKERWTEAAALAHQQLLISPWDADAWLTLGVATHRQKDDKTAEAAFDSAMANMSPSDRARFDDINRILSTRDAAKLASRTEPDQLAMQRHYWLQSDPLWSLPHTPPHIEFLSRVAYSDLRWSVDELGVRGADTDRGELYVRYGPPDLMFSLSPNAAYGFTDVTQWWSYRVGLLFAVTGTPTMGTMHFPVADFEYATAMTDAAPVRWDNLTTLRITTLPIRAARFRAGKDSVELVVAAIAPVDSIKKREQVTSNVGLMLWLMDRTDATIVHDSVEATKDVANAVWHTVHTGYYFLRAEAAATGSSRAASVDWQIHAGNDDDLSTGFGMAGFGMSDVLLATQFTAPAGTPRSWHDFRLSPLAGAHSRKAPLTLVWESYGLGQADGQAKYEIAVTLEHEHSLISRVAAEILDRLAALVRTDRALNKVTFRFDRNVPYSETIVEGVPIGLTGTPEGSYKVTVAITDHVTGRTTSRTTTVEIQQ
jgi:GWxTD domain-containing protein